MVVKDETGLLKKRLKEVFYNAGIKMISEAREKNSSLRKKETG